MAHVAFTVFCSIGPTQLVGHIAITRGRRLLSFLFPKIISVVSSTSVDVLGFLLVWYSHSILSCAVLQASYQRHSGSLFAIWCSSSLQCDSSRTFGRGGLGERADMLDVKIKVSTFFAQSLSKASSTCRIASKPGS